MNPLDPDFSSKISSRQNIFHEKSGPYWMAGYEMFWPARARLFSKKIFETVVENDSDTVSEIPYFKYVSNFKAVITRMINELERDKNFEP